MTLLGGVDAGGSHTEAVVADSSLTVLARRSGPAAAVRPDDVQSAAAVICDTLRAALSLTGGQRVTALAVGAAGVGRRREQSALASALKGSLGADVSLLVTTDGEIALADAFPSGEAGIVVIAGTGSVAFARDERGEIRRSGGLGPLLGDEGSGFSLARAALEAVARAADDRGPATALTAPIHAATQTKTLEDLVRWARVAERERVAALARTVCDAAHEGDAVARELVQAAASELAKLVTSLEARFAVPEIRVALLGSVIAAGSPVRTALVEQITALVPRATVLDHAVDPARGALRLAASLLA